MSGIPGLSGEAKLVMMANQIAKFFTSQKDRPPADGAAEHMRLYWEPRMRKAILAHVDAGGEGLDAVAKAAVEQLRQPAA